MRKKKDEAGQPLQRILVIDDDVSILRQVRIGLRRAGYEVVTARDGKEGIQRVSEKRPKAIVLDLEMPGMDGHSFLEVIKGHPAVRDIPIIVLTGRTDYEMMRESYDKGSEMFLNKPVEIGELVEAIRTFVRR